MKKYERLEIRKEEFSADRTGSVDIDILDSGFRCEGWPGFRADGLLHLWNADEEESGLSERGLKLCLNALGRWQGEHLDQKVMLCPDGEYRVVPLDTAERFEQISEMHDDADRIAKREFLKGAEKAIQEGRMVEDWDGT